MSDLQKQSMHTTIKQNIHNYIQISNTKTVLLKIMCKPFLKSDLQKQSIIYTHMIYIGLYLAQFVRFKT